jgi:hypothetical protein
MKKLTLTILTCLIFLSPNIVMSETWICAYKVYGKAKPIQFKRIPKGFKSKGIFEPIIYSILSETDRRIVIFNEYDEGVFITLLDKKHTEFISSGVFAPAQLRRGGAKMDTHKFNFNHGKCEVLD